MKTQTEQIKAARWAYLFPLNTTGSRWAVYLAAKNSGELKPLWPGDSHLGEKTKELIGGQIYSKAKQYVAFHFYLNGYGFSKQAEITENLQAVNPTLIVRELTGCIPVAWGKEIKND